MSEGLLYQCLLGIQCKGFVMLAADQMNIKDYIMVVKDDDDKLHEVTDNVVLGVNGEMGDMNQFTQYVTHNLKLYKMRNNYQLDVPAVAHFTRKSLADGHRGGGTPYMLNLMVAGYDKRLGAELYAIDETGGCNKTHCATHGLGGLLACGIMDRYYKSDLTMSEAYEVLKMCVREIQLRQSMNLSRFRVKSVSKHGIATLPDISSVMVLQKSMSLAT